MTDQATERCVIVAAGVSRSGKSTWTRRYLLNAPLAYRFIWDEQHAPESYAHRLGRAAATDELELGVGLCSGWAIFNPHSDNWPLDSDAVKRLGKMSAALNWFCDWTFKKIPRLPGRKALVIDEAWKHINRRRYPIEIAQCPQSGAGYQLECIFGTQIPERIPEPIQNELTEAVVFHLGGEESLNWAESKGFKRAEVQALAPQWEYIARNLDTGGELRGRIEL